MVGKPLLCGNVKYKKIKDERFLTRLLKYCKNEIDIFECVYCRGGKYYLDNRFYAFSYFSSFISRRFFVSIIAQGGIPKRGDFIRAPKKTWVIGGWVLILISFMIQILLVLSKSPNF